MVLEAQELTFDYDGSRSLNVGQFALSAGESVAVLGPSGCGKTTFLHLLAGLLQPTAGRIRILGSEIGPMSGAALDRFRGQHIGMVFQRLFLMPGLTVWENVALAQRLARKPHEPARVDALLEDLGLGEFAQRKPRTLSHGQAQRVAIARALVHRPEIVLADEPTSALDDDNSRQALRLLKDVTQAAGAALLVVTHDQRVRGELDREFDMEPMR